MMSRLSLILILILLILVIVYMYIYANKHIISADKPKEMHSIYRLSSDLKYNGKSLSIPLYYTIPHADSYYKCTCLLLESLSKSEYMLQYIKLHPNIKVLFSFKGIDMLCNKLHLAKRFTETFPDLIPISFDTNNISAINRFLKEHKGTYVVLKKNVQQQKGIYITDCINKIKSEGHKYVVCQELLQNPYIIAKHKINIRLYVIVRTYKGKTSFYRFNDGFIYYAPSEWSDNVSDFDVNITSGLKDRSLYKDNPLTYKDLQNYLNETDAVILDRNISHLCSAVKTCYEDIISNNNKKFDCVCTQILGYDIAPDADLNVKLMEINKGPDMRFKDERDKQVKELLISDFQKHALENYVSDRMINII